MLFSFPKLTPLNLILSQEGTIRDCVVVEIASTLEKSFNEQALKSMR